MSGGPQSLYSRNMLAYIILVLAALSRLLPHALHITALNVTAAGAGLLFFGSRRPRIEAVVAAVVMAITDIYLTRVVYGYPFHPRGYIVTWCWYAAAALIGSALLRRVTVLRVVAGVFASATGFFLLSNFMVWMGSVQMYPHTAAGLVSCYVAGLPFYRNDLLSTGAFSAIFFGVPVLAARLALRMHRLRDRAGSVA